MCWLSDDSARPNHGITLPTLWSVTREKEHIAIYLKKFV